MNIPVVGPFRGKKIMKRFHVLLLLSLVGISVTLLSVSCKSHKKSKNGMSANTTTTKDTGKTKPQVSSADIPKMAPGTAEVSARVIMYDESAPLYVTLQIIGARAYGMATPALPAKTEIKADISKALLNKHSMGEIKEEFTTSDTLLLMLSFSQQMAVGGASHKWTVISFNKN